MATLQANVDAVLSSGGIACINHPNDDWAFDHEEIGQVSGASLLEIFNGVIWCNSFGGPRKFGGEEIWDKVLSAGKSYTELPSMMPMSSVRMWDMRTLELSRGLPLRPTVEGRLMDFTA